MMNNDSPTSFSFIADFDGDVEQITNGIDLPEELPLLPLRNMVIFPSVMVPVSVGRKSSLRLVKEAERTGQLIGVCTQRDPNTQMPRRDDIHANGVAARVLRLLELPDGTTQAIIQGLCVIKIGEITGIQPFLRAKVHKIEDTYPKTDNEKFAYQILVEELRKKAKEYVSMNDNLPAEAAFPILNVGNDNFFVNFACCNFPLPIKSKLKMLKISGIMERGEALMHELSVEMKYFAMRERIHQKTQADLNAQQREYFLHQQMRNIQEELGEANSPQRDSEELLEKGAEKQWSEKVFETFKREVSKLDRLQPQSPDYNVQYTYLQTMLSLPWDERTTDNLRLSRAQKQLDKDHYGMEKVKERILEHLAVMKLRGDLKSPIICLYGPPGVGKTSLGRSIAESLGRKYVRVSLGGLHDESEIRGHRRTYISTRPGPILEHTAKAGSCNPVFVLDEIDKITQNTHQGDPASALLEVLDPAQNSTFHDNYLDIDYDLSNVLFVATANNIGTIPQPLLDRMELIEVSGYVTEEKIEIAKRHLIPKAMEENGLMGQAQLKWSKAAIESVIENYTRESGVRGLEKQISKVLRKMALQLATKGSLTVDKVSPELITQLLGKPLYSRDKYQTNEVAGVVTGLAWTAVGGEILFIETSLSKGKAGKLTLTGNLGDVMKESAVLALEYIKAHADTLNIDPRIFDHWNIHIHVPEGAVPKDGPSAGITMATSLASALTQRMVRSHLAMTGEITLRGKVLPVGGIKEKILAAKRAGITDIMLCEENRKDIEEIPEMYLKGVTFHYVQTILDVWDYALLKQKVAHPIDFTIEEEKPA